MIYYFLLFFLILFVGFFFRKKGLSYPANLVLGMVFLYFVFKYFCHAFFDWTPSEGLELVDLNLPGFYILIFFVLTFIIFFSFYFSRFKINLPEIILVERVPFGFLSYFLFGVTWTIIIVIGGMEILSSPLEIRDLMTGQGMYYFSILLYFITTYYSLKLFYQKKYKKLVVFTLVFLPYALVSGRSALLVSFVVNFFIFRAICFRKPMLRYVLILVPLLVVYVVSRDYHQFISGSSENYAVYLSGSGSAASDNLGTLVLKKIIFRIDQLERFADLSSAMQKGEVEVQYGQHMSQVTIQWIPRVLWPDKPWGLTRHLTQIFHPDVFDQGYGNSYTGIGELIYNFGIFGLPIGAIIYGFILYVACQIWNSARGSFVKAFFLVAIINPYIISGPIATFVNDDIFFSTLIMMLLMILFFKIKLVKSTQFSIYGPQLFQ